MSLIHDPHVKKAVENYAFSSRHINRALRNGQVHDEEDKQTVHHLDRAFEHASHPRDEMFHRGVDGDFAKGLSHLKKGDVVRDKAYSSMTSDHEIHTRFRKSEDGASMAIHVKKGARVLPVHLHSGRSNEKESLIHRDSELHYSHTDEGGVHHFNLHAPAKKIQEDMSTPFLNRLVKAIQSDHARVISEDGGAGGGAMGGGGTSNASIVANAPREEPLKKGAKGMVRRGAVMRFER